MDIQALQLESRFSLNPNLLGYCGKQTATVKFKKCISKGVCRGVKKEITDFIVLYPYLKTTAKITSLPPFSYPVIESYWIGNEELEKAKLKDYDLLLNNFTEQGVPDFFIEELRNKRPKEFIPTHLFQVLHVGVGKASGSVPFNIKTINDCMIRWGKIEESNKDTARVSLSSLEIKDEKYRICKKTETLAYGKEIVPELKKDDIAAVHWGGIVKILTKREEKNLDYWTRRVCEALD